MTIGIEEDLILPAVAGLSAILIVLFSQFYMLQSTYEDEATVLSSKIRSLYQENDKLEAQIKELKESDPQQVRDLKLQLKLVEDGASIEEAKHILEVSTEAGVSPKF
jgi:cell division protein FtsL